MVDFLALFCVCGMHGVVLFRMHFVPLYYIPHTLTLALCTNCVWCGMLFFFIIEMRSFVLLCSAGKRQKDSWNVPCNTVWVLYYTRCMCVFSLNTLEFHRKRFYFYSRAPEKSIFQLYFSVAELLGLNIGCACNTTPLFALIPSILEMKLNFGIYDSCT